MIAHVGGEWEGIPLGPRRSAQPICSRGREYSRSTRRGLGAGRVQSRLEQPPELYMIRPFTTGCQSPSGAVSGPPSSKGSSAGTASLLVVG